MIPPEQPFQITLSAVWVNFLPGISPEQWRSLIGL